MALGWPWGGLGVALGGFAPISAFCFLLSALARMWLWVVFRPYFYFLLSAFYFFLVQGSTFEVQRSTFSLPPEPQTQENRPPPI
jgi:hypothetical protein